MLHRSLYQLTRMLANAQRDGRPAEYRWRPLFNATTFGWHPLFNATTFGWHPLLKYRAVTLPRRKTLLKLHEQDASKSKTRPKKKWREKVVKSRHNSHFVRQSIPSSRFSIEWQLVSWSLTSLFSIEWQVLWETCATEIIARMRKSSSRESWPGVVLLHMSQM